MNCKTCDTPMIELSPKSATIKAYEDNCYCYYKSNTTYKQRLFKWVHNWFYGLPRLKFKELR